MIEGMAEEGSYSTMEQQLMTAGTNPNTQNMGGNDQYDSLHRF